MPRFFGLRILLFAARLICKRSAAPGRSHRAAPLGAALLPLHRVVAARPLYAAIRWVFHVGLAVVAVFFSGHVVMWEMSSLEWSWSSLPDVWADGLTLLLLALCVWFIIRRLARPHLRKSGRITEWLAVWLVALPLASGWLLAHGGSGLGFIDDNLFTLHVFLGELMLIGSAFLMVGLKIRPDACVGCAACGINCPIHALQVSDTRGRRSFSHFSGTCLVCGRCVAACPESAVGLYHDFSWRALFGGPARREIQNVSLSVCEDCGTVCAPADQLQKITLALDKARPVLCPDCQAREQMKRIFPMTPQLPQNQEEADGPAFQEFRKSA